MALKVFTWWYCQ